MSKKYSFDLFYHRNYLGFIKKFNFLKTVNKIYNVISINCEYFVFVCLGIGLFGFKLKYAYIIHINLYFK